MVVIPHFVQNELDAGDTDLADRLSAFNWCNPFDHILPFSDGTVSAADRAHLWGLYSGIEVSTGEAEAAAVTGGYTPYAVYDPGQEKRLRAKRRELRRERQQLREDLKRLVAGEPQETQEAPPSARGRPKAAPAPSAAPEAARVARQSQEAANAAALQAAAISARQARLEALQNELLLLDAEFQVIQARVRAEARRQARENELLAILLLAS